MKIHLTHLFHLYIALDNMDTLTVSLLPVSLSIYLLQFLSLMFCSFRWFCSSLGKFIVNVEKLYQFLHIDLVSCHLLNLSVLTVFRLILWGFLHIKSYCQETVTVQLLPFLSGYLLFCSLSLLFWPGLSAVCWKKVISGSILVLFGSHRKVFQFFTSEYVTYDHIDTAPVLQVAQSAYWSLPRSGSGAMEQQSVCTRGQALPHGAHQHGLVGSKTSTEASQEALQLGPMAPTSRFLTWEKMKRSRSEWKVGLKHWPIALVGFQTLISISMDQ